MEWVSSLAKSTIESALKELTQESYSRDLGRREGIEKGREEGMEQKLVQLTDYVAGNDKFYARGVWDALWIVTNEHIMQEISFGLLHFAYTEESNTISDGAFVL